MSLQSQLNQGIINTEITSISQFLQSFNFLTDTEIDAFLALSTKKTLNKFDYFIREGDTCKYVAFVLSGILRSHYTSDKGEEITYCISFPNNFMTAYSSFLTSQPTRENIQAITKTELLIFPKDKMDLLVDVNSNWTIFLKIMAEQQYIDLENRFFLLQASNATKRYTDLISNYPEYIQRVPLVYLASYLGVSQRHLSRIRSEVTL